MAAPTGKIWAYFYLKAFTSIATDMGGIFKAVLMFFGQISEIFSLMQTLKLWGMYVLLPKRQNKRYTILFDFQEKMMNI